MIIRQLKHFQLLLLLQQAVVGCVCWLQLSLLFLSPLNSFLCSALTGLCVGIAVFVSRKQTTLSLPYSITKAVVVVWLLGFFYV